MQISILLLLLVGLGISFLLSGMEAGVFALSPNRICMGLVLPFRLVHWVLKPLVGLMALFSRSLLAWSGGRRFTRRIFGTREELRMVMQESAVSMTSEEKTMINRVLDLQNRTV